METQLQAIEAHGLRTWFIHELTASFYEARKNKLKTFNEHKYDERAEENIIHLADAILERYYEPSASVSFVIHDPMIREIFAAPFVDRVVHHFLYKMQSDWWDKRFINDSYSCRDDKGTLFGILRAQTMMRRASKNFTEKAYIIKLDIRGYFMSLPRIELLKRVQWGLRRQFAPYRNRSVGNELYKLCYFLWRQILLDNPVKKSWRRGSLHDWDILPPEKSLYTQAPGKGIVIGNLTSQLISNIYLDQLDRFIVYTLGYKYYGRYVDDFFIIVPESEYAQAKRDVKKIEHFLDGLGLTLHPKKRYFQSVYKGMSFLGAHIYPHCVYPSHRFQKKFERILREFRKNRIRDESMISYFGYLMHMNADKYVQKIFTKYHYDYRIYLEFKDQKHRRPVKKLMSELKKPFVG